MRKTRKKKDSRSSTLTPNPQVPALLSAPVVEKKSVPPVEAVPVVVKPEPTIPPVEPIQTVPDPVLPSPPPVVPVLWHGAAQASVGAAHLKEPPIPCQDAALFDGQGLPTLIVCDGAGSARLSHLGAQAVVMQLRRLIRTLNKDLSSLLNQEDASPDALRATALRFVKHSIGVLEDTAETAWATIADVRCTLLLVIAGQRGVLWLRVGDGALVARSQDGTLSVLGESGKGEFANQTQFLNNGLNPDQVQWGYLDSLQFNGFAAMTDGAAERLVSTDGLKVAPRLGYFLDTAQNGLLNRRQLHTFLNDPSVWEKTTGDDRSLAIMAKRS